jgi:regulator of cell morphogenesis and NO signaling
MNERLERATVGEIVATDFRAAAIFEGFGIDFCCGGRRSLVDACRTADADPLDVMKAIDALPKAAEDDADVTRWPLDRLIDHIVETHHAYVRRALPAIARHLAKLQQVHGERHPELARIARVFDEVSDELSQHLLKEEQVLFPYVRDLGEREGDGEACGGMMSPFGTVENPIRMMEREHREAADALRIIRELTHEYVAPHDGCGTYQVCMAELAEFERDLHHHVHLENNVLFPRAVALEKDMWSHD